MPLPVQNVVLVHGYSETSLGAYYNLPELLSAANFGVESIVLSAFDSLDDHVTIDDLAAALEQRVLDLEAESPGLIASSAFICHSTGALVTRRWLLNRFAKGRGAPDPATVPQIPARVITMAGANHGSSLAEIGKSPVGYLQKLIEKHQLTVGRRVLTDLDYGSAFLLRLNDEWLAAWNDDEYPLGARVLPFSLGGDFKGWDKLMDLFWGTCERGSDNTVRISGANLNYSVVKADASTGAMRRIAPKRRAPHRIVPGYSHWDGQTGILHAPDANDAAFALLLKALQVPENAYDALAATWDADNAAWSQAAGIDGVANVEKTNATLVFNVTDRSGAGIEDCMIAFWDQAVLPDPNAGALRDLPPTRPVDIITPDAPETPEEEAFRLSVIDATLKSADAILDNSPIHNNVERGSYSFYINQPKWRGADGTRRHAVYIEALSDSPYIGYKPIVYQTTDADSMLVRPNEFTYIFVTLDRDTDQMFAAYTWQQAFDLPSRQAAKWRPFVQNPFRVPPRPKGP
jgi:hypothetical protein